MLPRTADLNKLWIVEFSEENWLIEKWNEKKSFAWTCRAYKWFQAIIHCSLFLSANLEAKKVSPLFHFTPAFSHFSIFARFRLDFCHFFGNFSVAWDRVGILFFSTCFLLLAVFMYKNCTIFVFLFLVVVDRLTFMPLSRH